MADFDIKILSTEDGTWEAFQNDWKAQCDVVGEAFDEYAPDVFDLMRGIVSGSAPALGGTNRSVIGALWDAETKRYYAACILNRVMLPSTSGYTLRVRNLIVSPLIDYGVSEVQMYPDVVIGLTLGIIHLSSTDLQANNVHLHMRSPEDMSYFRAFSAALESRKVFASVQIRGAWLYIEKAGAVGTASVKEA